MIKKIILFFLISISLAENSIYDLLDAPRTDKTISREEKNKNPIISDSFTSEDDIDINSANIYDDVKVDKIRLKTLFMPNEIHQGQIFRFDLGIEYNSELDFEIDSLLMGQGFVWLNKNLIWNKIEEEDHNNSNSDQTIKKYMSSFYILINDLNKKSLKIQINLKKNQQIYKSLTSNIFLPNIIDLRPDSDYSNLVASSLEIDRFKTNKFDDDNNIMLIHLSSKNSDLNNFRINNPSIIKQGIDNINGDFNSSSAYYFAVFSSNKNNLNFNYFNIDEKEFKYFSLPVKIENDELSTHNGLNPRQNDIYVYKKYFFYIVFVIGIIFLILRPSIKKVIFNVVLLIFILSEFSSLSVIRLSSNAEIRILPTDNSSIFYVTGNEESAKLMDSKDKFKKILLENGKIGWIKNEDIVKD